MKIPCKFPFILSGVTNFFVWRGQFQALEGHLGKLEDFLKEQWELLQQLNTWSNTDCCLTLKMLRGQERIAEVMEDTILYLKRLVEKGKPAPSTKALGKHWVLVTSDDEEEDEQSGDDHGVSSSGGDGNAGTNER